MSDNMQGLTEDTLQAIHKAQTNGILTSTGIYSYDLQELVRLIPVVTPFREKVGRVNSNDGNPFTTWRALLNVNNQQPRVTPGMEFAANLAVIKEQDFQAFYRTVALGDTVSQDAFDLAKGYNDPFAEATVQTLNQLLIGEEVILIGGQGWALAQPTGLALAQSASGGTIGAVTAYVGVAPRTASGYYNGGNGRGASTSTTFASGSTNKITATVNSVLGAVAYDWFYSANGSTWFYVTTTSTTSVVITSVIAANQPLPSQQVMPNLDNAIPTYNGSADNGSCPLGGDGATPAEPDGLISTLTASYTATGAWVTPGTGGSTANPAQANNIDNLGAALALSGATVGAITTLLANIWNTAFTSPSALMMNAITAQEISSLILSSPAAVTYLQTEAGPRLDVTAGGKVTQVVNVAAGTTVPIEIHPYVPPGIIIARTDRVPFPNSNISNTLQVRTLRDYSQFDYGVGRLSGANGGPRKDFEIRSVEAFVNFAPVVMGILYNFA